MKQEMELKLLAYVDGELPAREAKGLADAIAGDQEAQALVAELRLSKQFLAGNEPEMKVPETREFYWSQIARAIERAEPVAETASRFGDWLAWRKLLAPLAGVAMVVFLSVATITDYDFSFLSGQTRLPGEVENHSEHTSSFSFRSHSENMFVVWVYDKNDDASNDVDSEANDDEPVAQ